MSRTKKYKPNKALKSLISLVLVCVALFEFYGMEHSDIPKSELTITMLDVGQGDSILISQGENHALIDTNTEGFYQEVSNTMKGRNIKKLDYLIATHPHADHIGSMANVLEDFSVTDYLYTDCPSSTYTYKRSQTFAKEYADNMRIIKKGDSFTLGNAKITALSPYEGYKSDTVNNYSAVLLLEYNGFKALFMGDAQSEIEDELLKSGIPDVDLLKVGHHGSYTSSTKEFIKAASPEIALISLGKDNEYGFPHQIVLNNLKAVGSKVYRTDLEGSITVSINESGEYEIS